MQRPHASTTIFPLPFEVQLRLSRLCTCIHRQPKPNLCSTALLFKHHGGTVDSRAQASPIFFSSFTNLRRAGLSEKQCLCVFVMFHLSSHLIFRVLKSFFRALLILNGVLGIVRVVRWIGLKILILKHTRESKIWHQEQILAQKR